MRGKIIQYNGADGSGTLVVDGRQHRFALEVWRADSAPTVNKVVEVTLDNDLVTAVAAVDSLDQALQYANDNVYGLTAGVYSEDDAEVQRFLDEIQAGVLYVNRRAGATTGAWPGVQAFGGWKGSGSTGKSGLSMYYVAQFLREQSHTVVD